MAIRRFLWRACYEALARRVSTPDWAFMNYGYAPATAVDVPPLRSSDERDRLCIQLYLHAIDHSDLQDKDVLEVGSGRGGGAFFICRYLQPRSITGLDFSPEAVNLCNRHRLAPGLGFVCGDAQSMPFPASSFDAVVNIESSHCYESMDTFLSEVCRVLRPGGRFFFADLRSRDGVYTPSGTVQGLRPDGGEGDRHHSQRPNRSASGQCPEAGAHRRLDPASVSPAVPCVRRHRRNQELRRA